MSGPTRLALTACGAALVLVGCAVDTEEDAMRAQHDAKLQHDLSVLRHAKIFFGHHSVGQDVLDGLEELSHEAGIDVAITDAPIGENQQPLKKIDDFVARIERNGDGLDLALMKLCYVDFNPHTDVDVLFARYKAAVDAIKRARPTLRVVHVTAPLHARQVDLKSRVNRGLGRLVWEDAANAKRQQFNEALRSTFGDDPLFDLAGLEATRPDGDVEEYVVDGERVPMLFPGYTRDGGHLNNDGKRLAARAFAHTIAEALSDRE